MTPGNTIIYLIGFAGTGKYTIACELAKMTGAKLVDNHLINNPIFSVIEQDGKTKLPLSVWNETAKIRKAVLHAIRTISPPHYSFVFTNELYQDDPDDLRIYRQIARLASARDAAFFPIRLLCNAAELHRRKSTPDRRAHFKEIDVSTIEWLLTHHEVLKINHPNLLTLDVSDITAEQSAGKILAHVRKSCPLKY